MIQVIDEKKCCGCAACAAICPKQCIHMVPGTLGAIFPRVETMLCIRCGACEQVCPLLNDFPQDIYHQNAYAAIAKDSQIRFEGSSGGIFAVLAGSILAEGGIVYGASFDENMKLRCTAAKTAEGVRPLCKSKYLQSDLLDKFQEILQILQDGRQVMFVATPCQNAALKQYLKRNYSNLLSVDFFCHGVPSQQFFNDCISYVDQQKHITTLSYEFRTKKQNGVTPHYFTRTFEKAGKKLQKSGYYFESPFYAAFQQYVTLRESCYNCKFCGRERVSDITIGDFHDINKYINGVNRFDGVSTIITNTDQGALRLEKVKPELELYDMNIEQLIYDKTIFAGCTARPPHRDAFIAQYEKHGIPGLMRTYLNKKRYLKHWVYYQMPAALRRIIQKKLQ